METRESRQEVNNTDGSHGGNIKGTLTANKEYAQNKNEREKEY